MTKQNFISMSLESGLKYVDLLCEPDDNICTLKGILNGIYCDEHGNVDCEINDCMPILRPLSDLTKEIEHGGEKFVPIVELAKIAEFVPNEIDSEFNELCLCNNYTVSFFYRKESFIAGRINYKENDWIDDLSVPNQFQLFQRLIEWHFDILDLISKNQAIDINTLETNPYK